MLTYLCVRNGSAWRGRCFGYTFACFHSDRDTGLLDFELTGGAKDGDLYDLINKRPAAAEGPAEQKPPPR